MGALNLDHIKPSPYVSKTHGLGPFLQNKFEVEKWTMWDVNFFFIYSLQNMTKLCSTLLSLIFPFRTQFYEYAQCACKETSIIKLTCKILIIQNFIQGHDTSSSNITVYPLITFKVIKSTIYVKLGSITLLYS